MPIDIVSSVPCEIIVGAMWYFVVALVVVVTLIWQMTDLKARVVDLIARNLREPKGLVGHLVRIILGKGNASLENETVKHLNIQPDHKVLEIGFGPGIGLNAALEKVEHSSGKVYGIDISEQIVESAQRRFKEAIKRGKLEIRLGSAMELPYEDDLFNSVFHTNCYYFWPSLEQGISEMKRVLKPGGIMLTGLFYDALLTSTRKGFLKYGPNWRPELYIEKLKEGGFVDVAMETVTKPSGHSYQVIFSSKP